MVTEPDKIDIIATRESDRLINLIITDHLEWSDIESHLRILQEKLNKYIEFVESGQVREHYPPYGIDKTILTVRLLYTPPEATKDFFERVSHVLKGIDMEFEVRLTPDDERASFLGKDPDRG